MAKTAELASEKTRTFSLKSPLLAAGRTMDLLAATDMMTAHVKVYAEGGENVLHAHTEEDHLFVILAGQATFYLGREERLTIVNKHEGVLIPKGNHYWFHASGDENLVLLRVGAKKNGYNGVDDRVGAGGNPLPGESAANKHVAPVTVPGKFFS
jgi:mannose-6-phosphate isomerase-like protein (cupin superfamily)